MFNGYFRANTIRGNASTYAAALTRVSNCTFTTPYVIQGSFILTTCSNITITDEVYVDAVSGTTVTTYAMYVWNISTGTKGVYISGLTLPVTNTHPYTALAYLNTCNSVKIRNIATRSAPLNLGSSNACGLVWAMTSSSDIKIQRVYVYNTRTGQMTGDNSCNRVLVESVYGDFADAADVGAVLNYKRKGIGSTLALTAQTAVYGTHWADYFITGTPANLAGISWSRSTTTATITSTGHGLKTGDLINVTVTSDAAAIIKGQKSITVVDANTFTFTCLNAGAASGTLTMEPINGRIALLMNEATALSASQITLSGGAAFTSAGGLYMPTVGHQAIFKTPDNIRGISGFPIIEPVMGAGGAITNFDILYSLDAGSTWKNLLYPRAGGGGSNGSTTVTMTSTTGVNAGDYVYGTNIAPLAKVQSVDSSTNITVTIANTGTVSGILRFSQLPNETVSDPTTGQGFWVKMTTSTANTTAITSLYFSTKSTDSDRNATYPLDLATIYLYNLVSGSDIVILSAGTTTEIANVDANSGSTYSLEADPSVYANVDVCVYKKNYVPFTLRNLSFTSSGLSLQINQVADRNYTD